MASNMIRPIGPDQIVGFSQQDLRDHLLVEDLLVAGETRCVATHYDRVVAVGAVPTSAPLTLEPVPEIRSEFFLEHREIGFVNVGAQGTIVADGVEYEMAGLCQVL